MTTPTYLKPLEAAKAYAALVGGLATTLLAVFTADTTVGKVLTVVALVATFIGTYKIPNAEAPVDVVDVDVVDPDSLRYDGHADA